MKSQIMRQFFMLSAVAGLVASQSVLALPSYQHLDPAPDPDLLSLTKEDEAYIQGLFDQFDLSTEERTQLLHLIDPAVPGVIEDFDLSREPEAPVPMEEHPEYIELIQRISKMNPRAIHDCGPLGEGIELLGGDYYYLKADISCTLANSTDAGIFVGAGAILDLRGHQISSTNGVGRGIQLDERAFLFGGEHRRGLVTGFETGVYSEANSNLVMHVESSNNSSSSPDQGSGILFFTNFTGDGPHFFDSHRVLYSKANHNSQSGIYFVTTDALNTTSPTGDVTIFDNYVYATQASHNGSGNNGAGVLFDFESVYALPSYDHVDVYKNFVSHSHARDNIEAGIAIKAKNFNTLDGFGFRENHISHSFARCKPTLPCHADVGISLAVTGLADKGVDLNEVNFLDNSISFNWVDYSVGTGILYNISSVEIDSVNFNVSGNRINFNTVLYNGDGIDMTLFDFEGTTSGTVNIENNQVAFNRVAYSSGNGGSLQGLGIQVDSIAFYVCVTEAHVLNSRDNLVFANAVDQNMFGLTFVTLVAPISVCDVELPEALWTFNNNRALFNQVFHNVSSGLTFSGEIATLNMLEGEDNRVGFNRVVSNGTGIIFEILAESASSDENSVQVVNNQVDHNIVLENSEVGILFEIDSLYAVVFENSPPPPLPSISYKNRVHRNLVVGTTAAVSTPSGFGILANFNSKGYLDNSEKNGIFRNLVLDNVYGIGTSVLETTGTFSNNLVHRNFVAASTLDGIIVNDTLDTISDNISIFNGDYNFVDLPGQTDSTICNTWEDNFYVSPTTVLPPICFEVEP